MRGFRKLLALIRRILLKAIVHRQLNESGFTKASRKSSLTRRRMQTEFRNDGTLKRKRIFIERWRVPCGLLVGIACCLRCSLQAQTNYQRLWAFNESSGSPPSVALIEGSDGKLYGATAYGGLSGGNGTIFKLNRDGSGYVVLHYFTNTTGEGSEPVGLSQGTDGMLYGMTAYGGDFSGPPGPGFGTVFKLSINGSGYQVLHKFSTNRDNGKFPEGQIISDGGILYGTTTDGGSNDLGTLFKLHTDGSDFAIVRSFVGAADLAEPRGALVKATNGALYGVTIYAGSNNHAGAVFRINPDGSGFAVPHRFNDTNGDGYDPLGLTLASDGKLYGVTYGGGSNGCGVIFAMNPDGSSYALIHSFTGPGLDGDDPKSLIEGTDGALYGVTSTGGSFHAGAVFKLNKSGTGFTMLHFLTGSGGDGSEPATALLQASDGSFYGTTYSGGISDINSPLGYGTLFRLFSGPPRINITRIQSSGANLLLDFRGGAAGHTYAIQGTTHLATNAIWSEISTAVVAIDGSFQVIDTNASQFPARFYRSAGQ